MRVALDVTPLAGHRTGIGVFVASLRPRLASTAGVEIADYVVSHRAPRGADAPSRPPVPAAVAHRLWAHTDLLPVEAWAGDVDVVHGTNFVVPPARRAARVVSVHDLTAVHHPELCSPGARRFPALVRRAIERGAYVHTDSEWVRGEVIEHFAADADRVMAIALGVETTAGDPALGLRRAGGPYVLALGTAEPRKDLPSLVAAFDQLAGAAGDLRLVLAGPAGWGDHELAAAIGAARHGDRILRTGWVDDATRAALVAGAAAFAYPSRYEGFGLPPLEALAAGIPVVATAVGSLPEVLGDAAIFVRSGDVAALADALDAALRGEGPSAEIGRARAASFRWAATAAGMTELYRRCLNGDPVEPAPYTPEP